MKDELREQLSAAVDGEVDAREWVLLVRRLQDDPALRSEWASHHLIGEAIRGPGGAWTVGTAFADRVAAAIAGEPPVRASRRVSWMRLTGGLAVAASVAAVALLSLRPEMPVAENTPQAAVVVPVTANPQVGNGARFANAPGVNWELARPEVQAELNRLLLEHAESAREVADEEARP